MKNYLKRILLGKGRRGRRIPLGLYRGLTLSIDPATETNFYLGLYEAETTPWLRSAIRNCASLIDVGAGCGELSLWGLSKPWIRKVVAYDSAEARWPIFEENLRLNRFQSDPRFVAKKRMFAIDEGPEALVELFQHLPGPILLKIDVDGGEEVVLQEMRRKFEPTKLKIFLETHTAALDENCFQILLDYGFTPRRILPAWWRKIHRERRPHEFNQWIVTEDQK